jgi:hypothetical protein
MPQPQQYWNCPCSLHQVNSTREKRATVACLWPKASTHDSCCIRGFHVMRGEAPLERGVPCRNALNSSSSSCIHHGLSHRKNSAPFCLTSKLQWCEVPHSDGSDCEVLFCSRCSGDGNANCVEQKELRGLSPRANYAGGATAACRRT